MEFHYAPGATPLDPDEAAGLVPTHITTQGDLNAWEQVNIAQGDRWATRQKKRDLLDEGLIRDENHVYDADEMAVRFHHQLVWIHAFPNGNGRHARLLADLLVMRQGRPRLTWGGGEAAIASVGELRNHYITALRAADQGQFNDLNAFARS